SLRRTAPLGPTNRTYCPRSCCRRALPSSPRAALLTVHCPSRRALPCLLRVALPCALPACCLALQPARRPALQPAPRPALRPARRPALQRVRCPATTLCEWVVRRGRSGPGAWDFTRAGGTGQERQSRCQETLSPQQLREWVIERGRPGGGGYGAGGTGQQRQQRQQETLSLQELCNTCLYSSPVSGAPSGSLTGFHLPSFSKNLVSNAVLQDQFVTVTTPGGELVAICTDSRTGEHLTTFTWSPGYGLYTLNTESAQVAASGQDLPVLRLHSDRGSEFSSGLLRDFGRVEGIALSFTLPASPQQNGIAERRIGLVMDVARTSMIHAVAPKTSPTLRWMGEASDASAFRVWGALSLVRDTTASKLSARTLRYVFLGFPTDAPPWQFYHLASRCSLCSQDVTLDDYSTEPGYVYQTQAFSVAAELLSTEFGKILFGTLRDPHNIRVTPG
ncbi:unnamed protein product, partial [Closterium sp. NIES-53]